jgi:hypothetical protein
MGGVPRPTGENMPRGTQRSSNLHQHNASRAPLPLPQLDPNDCGEHGTGAHQGPLLRTSNGARGQGSAARLPSEFSELLDR